MSTYTKCADQLIKIALFKQRTSVNTCSSEKINSVNTCALKKEIQSILVLQKKEIQSILVL
jgi:hypothetical protein